MNVAAHAPTTFPVSRFKVPMTNSNRKPVIGRPLRNAERLSERLPPVYVTPTFMQTVHTAAGDAGMDMAEFGRAAFEFYLAHKDKEIDNPRSYRGKFLTKAPAGPWEEALAHAGDFVISEDTAEELQVRDGDVFVRAVGESMEGAGIWDNAMLLMRPMGTRSPRRNDIVLVQVQTEDGDHFGTIKHWQPGTVPKLTDGEGNDFALPNNTINIKAVAELQGIIALH